MRGDPGCAVAAQISFRGTTLLALRNVAACWTSQLIGQFGPCVTLCGLTRAAWSESVPPGPYRYERTSAQHAGVRRHCSGLSEAGKPRDTLKDVQNVSHRRPGVAGPGSHCLTPRSSLFARYFRPLLLSTPCHPERSVRALACPPHPLRRADAESTDLLSTADKPQVPPLGLKSLGRDDKLKSLPARLKPCSTV